MTGLAPLHWREPLLLLMLLLPWLALLWRRHRVAHNALRNFADSSLLPWLLGGSTPPPLRLLSAMLAWSLAILAAAGPYWQTDEATPVEQRGADIAVIVDISPSMNAADISPTRLDRVKQELRDFTTLLGNDRLGLVAFSANAYTLLPLSSDHDAFLRFADLLDPTLTERPGSNLARALEVAQRLLRDSAQDSRAMVLLSDGEYHDPDTINAARTLAAQHIPLFVLGVGTTGGAPVPDSSGHFMRYQDQPVISRLDRAGLQALAQSAQGSYFDLNDDDSEWRALIAQLRARTQAASHAAPQLHMPGIALYPWLLAASLVLFLWGGLRRREAIPMLLLLLPLFLMHPESGMASPWSEQQAYEALQRGDYAEAQQRYDDINSYSGLSGLGTAAYRQQDWQIALTAFKRAGELAGNDAQKARALFNTGNTLAQLHRYEAASNSYRAALSLQPDLARAALNLSLVNRFLDAQRGEQQRKDAKHALPNLGTKTENEPVDQQGRGNEPLPSNQRAESSSTPAGGLAAGQQAAQQRLQQTLALWRQAAEQGSGSPQLESLRDNSTDFLRRQFRQEDYGPKVKIIQGKPW